MPNFNKVILAGHLTRDIEMRNTQGGTAIAKFGIATNHTYGQAGEKKESVCFVDCTAWGRSAEVLSQFVKKGDPLLIEGRLELQQWDDKTTGAKRSKHEVVVENFQFLKAAPAKGGERSATPDEIPF